MLKEITAMQIRNSLGEILEEVYYQKNQFIIKRGKKTMAAVVPVEQLESWLKRRQEFFNLIAEIQEKNKDADPEQVERDVKQAIEEVRA